MKMTTVLSLTAIAGIGYVGYRLFTDGRLPEVDLVVDGETVASIPEVEIVHPNDPPAAE